jgi:hypothetical protein
MGHILLSHIISFLRKEKPSDPLGYLYQAKDGLWVSIDTNKVLVKSFDVERMIKTSKKT